MNSQAFAVRTIGLVKEFGNFRALDELNLEIHPGMIFGFLGPNGAGKTTTIRILTGLAHATHGTAWVSGIEVTGRQNTVSSFIGYLPEEPVFYPWMNAIEYLDHIAQVFRISKTERNSRVHELLDLVGLTHAARRRIAGYSRGMRQRLGLAQALINNPQVLFLDEPVSALDPAGRKEVLELIAQMRGKCTVFMSTHILGDVERICDTIGIINNGKMVTTSSRKELLDHYAVPVIEIEVSSGMSSQLTAWKDNLSNESWIVSTEQHDTVVRILVNDIEKAKIQLLASALQAGLVLERYAVVHPSLEDVFLKLVTDNEPKGSTKLPYTNTRQEGM